MPSDDTSLEGLLGQVAHRGPRDAALLFRDEPDERVALVLRRINPDKAVQILWNFSDEKRATVFQAAPPEWAQQWLRNHEFPENTIGRMMDPPVAVFGPETLVPTAIEQIRELVKKAFITYGFVVDADGKLLGILVMRELMLASPQQTLGELILRNPFYLTPQMPLMDAMKAVLSRHYPVYPVCDNSGKLVGLVRGQTLFEKQAIEISAQAGAMVGVEKEERLATPWSRSLKYRHPWLQINLTTAFITGAVVSGFSDTINRSIVLAAFLPILASQASNTGCQALAVVLRGFTLGEFDKRKSKSLIAKEGLVGLLNGILVGVVAAFGMFIFATLQKSNPAPLEKKLMLSAVIFIAISVSCMVAGIAGAIVPMILEALGFDPVTASSIFLTTATDITSMGTMLALAALLVK
ncbi:MAG TPA: magnesium transporter [Tepidisphaeraceae bacterium]|jgi:magnesium transporter